MIVEFFKATCHQVDTDEGVFFFATLGDRDRRCINQAIDVTDRHIPSKYKNVEKVAQIDFLDAGTEAVETLVDALLLGKFLIQNPGISGESALYILVNESIAALDFALVKDETQGGKEIFLTENN